MYNFEETIFDSEEKDKICFACNKDIENSSEYKNFKICTESGCNFHFHISAKERINLIIDSGSFKEINKSNKSGKNSKILNFISLYERAITIYLLSEGNIFLVFKWMSWIGGEK